MAPDVQPTSITPIFLTMLMLYTIANIPIVFLALTCLIIPTKLDEPRSNPNRNAENLSYRPLTRTAPR